MSACWRSTDVKSASSATPAMPFGSTSTMSFGSTRCHRSRRQVRESLVDLPIGPSIPVRTVRHQPDQRFTESVGYRRHQRIGVGWYHIEVRSGPCDGEFWVQVYGRSPFTTVIGVGAAGLLARRRRPADRLDAARSPRPVVAAGGVSPRACSSASRCACSPNSSVSSRSRPTALAAFLGGGALGGAGAAAAGSAGGAGCAAECSRGRPATAARRLVSPPRHRRRDSRPSPAPPRRRHCRQSSVGSVRCAAAADDRSTPNHRRSAAAGLRPHRM